MRIAVIGAGFSGMSFCININSFGKLYDIDLYEASNDVGLKILKTGNGRCNLSNEDISDKNYNKEFVEYIDKFGYIKNYYSDECIKFLDKINIKTRVDKGRIYPYSNKAESVKKAYEYALKKYRINVILNAYIDKIDIIGSKYKIYSVMYDYVIIATGGIIGSLYNGYELVKNLSVDISNLTPALVGIKIEEKIASLDGVRMIGEVTCGSFNEIGEIQFKKDGLSGIVIMNLSRYYNKGIISINFGVNVDKSYFNTNMEEKVMSMYPFKLASYILKSNNVVESIYSMKFTIKSFYGFDQAQITKGGVRLDQLCEGFELFTYKNIYTIGELIDVDGECGGYNIHNAICSGLISSRNVLNKIVK